MRFDAEWIATAQVSDRLNTARLLVFARGEQYPRLTVSIVTLVTDEENFRQNVLAVMQITRQPVTCRRFYRTVLRSNTVLSNTRLMVQIQRLPMNASGYRQ